MVRPDPARTNLVGPQEGRGPNPLATGNSHRGLSGCSWVKPATGYCQPMWRLSLQHTGISDTWPLMGGSPTNQGRDPNKKINFTTTSFGYLPIDVCRLQNSGQFFLKKLNIITTSSGYLLFFF